MHHSDSYLLGRLISGSRCGIERLETLREPCMPSVVCWLASASSSARFSGVSAGRVISDG